MLEPRVPFQLKKFGNYGASHPAVARLFLQMQALLDVTILTDEKTEIKQHLFRCSNEVVKAQQKKDAFLAKCRQFTDEVRAGRGITVHPSGVLQIDEPEELADDFQLFLIHLAIALRMAVKAAALILLKKSATWNPLVQVIEAQFPAGHPLREVLRLHSSWTDVVFEARGEIEHDPYIFTGFKVTQGSSGMLQLEDPKMPDGSSAIGTVPRYYDDALEFGEQLVVQAIATKFPTFVVLQEIPEPQRDPDSPIRYRTTVHQ